MVTFELIGKIVLGIGFLLIVKILWQLFMSWFSKTTKMSIYYRNNLVAKPTDYDAIKSNLTISKNIFIEKVVSAAKNLKLQKNSNYSISEKLKLLKELDELREKGVVTEEEFKHLRSEILD
jgi:hypothetical protein